MKVRRKIFLIFKLEEILEKEKEEKEKIIEKIAIEKIKWQTIREEGNRKGRKGWKSKRSYKMDGKTSGGL